MTVAVLMLAVGVVLVVGGAMAPAPWVGTLVGVALVVAGWVRVELELEDRRAARRRARRPGYITDRPRP